jgi:mutator protein MutT
MSQTSVSPEPLLPRIAVVAGLITRAGTVLIQQRHADGACANLWELPGGKIEAGEMPAEALVREAQEELGVTVYVGDAVFETVYADDERVIALQVFRADIAADAAPMCHAAQRQLWCPVAELGQWPFCPADVALIEALVSGALPLEDAGR